MILETCDLWDIWSEWWGDITWQQKNNDNDKDKDKEKTMTNTFREHRHFVTEWVTEWVTLSILEHMTSHWLSESNQGDLWPLETFDQGDEETWHDQKKDKDNDKEKYI